MEKIRLPGLASGLDVESLIKSVMTLERRPMTIMEQRQTALTSKSNAWRDLNQRMNTLNRRVSEMRTLTSQDYQARRGVSSDGSVSTATVTSNAATGSYSVEVTKLAQADIWQSSFQVENAEEALGFSGDMKIVGGVGDGKTITVSETDSLNDIAEQINDRKAELGISATVIQVNPGDYRLVLTGSNGTANAFTIENATDDDTVAADLGFTTATQIETAQNAEFKFNGIAISASDNRASNVAPGISLTLNKLGTTTITVSKDTAGVENAIKAVVDQFNQVMDFISSQTSYDEKTKRAGTLFGESMVRSITSSLNSLFTSEVGGQPDAFSSLAAIGIRREAFVAGQSSGAGKLTIDSAKLQKALQDNPDAVRNLFVANSGTDQGVAVRMSNWLEGYVSAGGLLPERSANLDKQVTAIRDRVQKFDEQILPQREQRMRAQFTALEKLMSTVDAQGRWLSAQLKALEPVKK